jgi:hypothetical protein
MDYEPDFRFPKDWLEGQFDYLLDQLCFTIADLESPECYIVQCELCEWWCPVSLNDTDWLFPKGLPVKCSCGGNIARTERIIPRTSPIGRLACDPIQAGAR